MALQFVQWGSISLHLDNETFEKAFAHGRQMYFDDCEYDRPHIAFQMNAQDAAGSVLDEDASGGYCFDELAFDDPLDILGFFLGYMSGPIIAESQHEHDQRYKHVVVLPEPAANDL